MTKNKKNVRKGGQQEQEQDCERYKPVGSGSWCSDRIRICNSSFYLRMAKTRKNVREAGSRNRNKRMVNATNQLDPDPSVIRPYPNP